MATLNTFGFTPRKGRTNLQHLPTKVIDRNQSLAFTQPIDIKPVLASPHNNNNNHKNTQTRKTVNKKANKKSNVRLNLKDNKKITQYFNITSTGTTSMPMDICVEEEEREMTCIIRKKIPFLTLFNEIENEYIQELLFADEEEEEQEIYNIKKQSKCRRYSEIDEENDTSMPVVFKRQKITLDTDLSSVMSKFLNIKSNVVLTPLPPTRIECLNEYKYEEEDDDKEDLRRYLRYKMSKEESSLFVLQITQEYLS